MSGTPNPYRHQYQTVAASSNRAKLGPTGAVGDFLHRIVLLSSGATSTFTLWDSGTSIFTAVSNLAAGVYVFEINAASQIGAWEISTGAGMTAIGIGTFTK